MILSPYKIFTSPPLCLLSGEDIFSPSSSAPALPSTSPPPPLPVEKEASPPDLFSEESSDTQMNLFGPGKDDEVRVTHTASVHVHVHTQFYNYIVYM